MTNLGNLSRLLTASARVASRTSAAAQRLADLQVRQTTERIRTQQHAGQGQSPFYQPGALPSSVLAQRAPFLPAPPRLNLLQRYQSAVSSQAASPSVPLNPPSSSGAGIVVNVQVCVRGVCYRFEYRASDSAALVNSALQHLSAYSPEVRAAVMQAVHAELDAIMHANADHSASGGAGAPEPTVSPERLQRRRERATRRALQGLAEDQYRRDVEARVNAWLQNVEPLNAPIDEPTDEESADDLNRSSADEQNDPNQSGSEPSSPIRPLSPSRRPIIIMTREERVLLPRQSTDSVLNLGSDNRLPSVPQPTGPSSDSELTVRSQGRLGPSGAIERCFKSSASSVSSIPQASRLSVDLMVQNTSGGWSDFNFRGLTTHSLRLQVLAKSRVLPRSQADALLVQAMAVLSALEDDIRRNR